MLQHQSKIYLYLIFYSEIARKRMHNKDVLMNEMKELNGDIGINTRQNAYGLNNNSGNSIIIFHKI